MNKLTLRFIMLFAPLFKRFGVDNRQLEIILFTKLTMDDRRPLAIGGQKTGKASKYSTWLTMAALVFTGLFLAFFLAVRQPYLGHTIYFSAFMIMLAVTLISDFTNVLIDVRDNYIILPRPVNDATFTFSRILHILIHVSKLAIALSLAGLIFCTVKEGVFSALIFLFEVAISTVLSIFMVNIIYLLVLKFSSPGRFKDFISYFQVAFSMVIFALYYSLPKLMQSSVLDNIDILSNKAFYILPPVWIASLHEVSKASATVDNLAYLLSAAAITAPFVCLFLIVRVLAPGFNNKLGAISGSGEKSGNPVKTRPTNNFMSRIANLAAPHHVENAGFRLTWLLTSRFRDFRVKVYPSFAYVPVYFIYFGFFSGRQENSFSERWEEAKSGNMYILLAYITGFVLISVLQHVSHSEKYKASWIYFTTSHNQPGRLLGGMYKAVAIKYFFPYFVIVSAFSLSFWGLRVFNDLLLAFSVSLIYGLLNALFLVKGFPFSKPPMIKANSKIFVAFILMIIPGAIGFGHYWLSSYEVLIWAGAIIFSFLYWVTFRFYVQETWKSLEMAD